MKWCYMELVSITTFEEGQQGLSENSMPFESTLPEAQDKPRYGTSVNYVGNILGWGGVEDGEAGGEFVVDTFLRDVARLGSSLL